MAEYKDYYKILGVNKNATDAEIKKAFKTMARKYHPDMHPESEKAKTEAYKKAVLGKIEGDIPMVSLQTDPAVVLHFQDYDYQDIRPELVRSVRGEFRDGTSDDPAWIRDDLAYEQEGSDIKVALDSGKFFQNMDAGDIYGTCVITIAYRYQGNDYISVTAVQVGR